MFAETERVVNGAIRHLPGAIGDDARGLAVSVGDVQLQQQTRLVAPWGKSKIKAFLRHAAEVRAPQRHANRVCPGGHEARHVERGIQSRLVIGGLRWVEHLVPDAPAVNICLVKTKTAYPQCGARNRMVER